MRRDPITVQTKENPDLQYEYEYHDTGMNVKIS